MHGYELLGRLAAGAMGEVFLARQRGPGGFARFVAVKRLLVHDDEHARRLLDEARTCASIEHPNVIGVIEVGEDAAGPFLVLEYVLGDTLAALSERARGRGRALPIAACVRAAHDVALGLHAAHARSVVHRDVKPSNILIGVDGRARVVDFGIALAHNEHSSARLAPRTRAGGVRGTVPYMSPEQVEGEAVDARSDQFSLGVALWEALAGRLLFWGAHDVATVARILTCIVPPLRSCRGDIPPALEDVLGRMLARSPAHRYPSCAAAAAALDAALDGAVAVAGADAALAGVLDDLLGDTIRRRHQRLADRTVVDLTAPDSTPQPTSLASAPTQEQLRTLDEDDAALVEITAPAPALTAQANARADAAAVAALGARALGTADATLSSSGRPRPRQARAAAREERRRTLSLASAGAVLVVAGVAAWAAGGYGLDDERAPPSADDSGESAAERDARNRAFFAELRANEAILVEATVVAEARRRGLLRTLGVDVVDDAALALAALSRRRLDVVEAHHALPERQRAVELARAQAKLDAIDLEAHAVLAPLGGELTASLLEGLWAQTRYLPLVWAPPPPPEQHAGVVEAWLVESRHWPFDDAGDVLAHFARTRGLDRDGAARLGPVLARLFEERWRALERRNRATPGAWHVLDMELVHIEHDAVRAVTDATGDAGLRRLALVLFRRRLQPPAPGQPQPLPTPRLARPPPAGAGTLALAD